MKKDISSGGIVIKNDQVLLIENHKKSHPNESWWGFPKGHPEFGESLEQASLREVEEETGVKAEILKLVGQSEYFITQDKEKIAKTVTIFLMKYLSGELTPQQSEVKNVNWVDLKEAKERLTFNNDKHLLEKAIDLHISNRFVSRGGIKLQAALDSFDFNVANLTVLDVGSSTGGFVDCLLQNGASKVYSVDTSYGELAWKLRNDPRVVVMERTNILHLASLTNPKNPKKGSDPSHDRLTTTSDLGSDPKVDLITIDASWTKLELILPVVQQFLKSSGFVIALLKPHYQTDKKDLVKGVLDKAKSEEVKNQVITKISELGFMVQNSIESPILGGGGNIEYLLLLKKTV